MAEILVENVTAKIKGYQVPKIRTFGHLSVAF